MRWATKLRPKPGEKRTRRVFAFLPVEIGHTTVWLEHYIVHENYCPHTYGSNGYWYTVMSELINGGKR